MLPEVLSRRHLLALHKRAKKSGLDVNQYNMLKDRAYELETTLKIIRGPLHEHQTRVEQQQRQRERSRSSSSSRSPSSSPSPSPSPERSLPKKGIFPERDTSKKPVPEGARFNYAWTYKDPREYWSPNDRWHSGETDLVERDSIASFFSSMKQCAQGVCRMNVTVKRNRGGRNREERNWQGGGAEDGYFPLARETCRCFESSTKSSKSCDDAPNQRLRV